MGKTGLFIIMVWALILPAPAALLGDELHKKDGTVLHGRLEKETGTGIKFKEAGAKSAKTHSKKDVQRVVLTFDLPDFVYNDPDWSKEMIDARIKQSFDPAWGEVEVLKSDHYVVFTNSSAGERYLKTMEDIYDKFTRAFPFEEPKKAPLMPVFLFKTRDHYNRFYANIAGISIAKAAQSGGHAWRDYYATYYQAPKDPVHYHEGAHQLVHNRLHVSGGGSWLQEGFAVYFEGLVFTAEDVSLGMKSLVRQKGHTHLREMIALRSLLYSKGSGKASQRYQQAGALMKFMVEGPDRESFTAMVEGVKNGDPWEDIFRNVYGRSVDEMDQAFIDFYKDYKR
jgi:hypothetical protein